MSRASSTAPKRSKKNPSSLGRMLYLDCYSGIAGNMFLAAMLEAGLSRKLLESELAGLKLDYSLRVSRVQRGALAARYLQVLLPKKKVPRGKKHQHHGRSFRSIVELLNKAKLQSNVRERSLAVFEAIGRAEAKVHGVSLEKIHFHEVGAVDAMVDIVGAAIAVEALEIHSIQASTVALGSGSVETEHGRLPLPAPATLELLKGIPTQPAHVNWETVTPTGAGILRTFVDNFGPLPAMQIEAVGYGAGDDRPGPMPNCLRVVVGVANGMSGDRVDLLECQLDDLNPEHFDDLMERLFDASALDVSLQHLQMKKNRPGFLLRVLCRPADRLPLGQLILTHSSAIGLRVSSWDRMRLARENQRVKTPFGVISVKRVVDPQGNVLDSPEYEDCKAAARKAGVKLTQVIRAAEEAAGRR